MTQVKYIISANVQQWTEKPKDLLNKIQIWIFIQSYFKNIKFIFKLSMADGLNKVLIHNKEANDFKLSIIGIAIRLKTALDIVLDFKPIKQKIIIRKRGNESIFIL